MRILVKIDKSRALKLGSDITSDQVVEILADSLKDKEIFLDSSLSFEERKIADFKFKIQVAIATQEEVLREISSTLEDKAVKIEKAIELFLSQKDEEKISDVESLLFDAEIVFPKLNFSYPLDSYRYFEKNISKTDEKVLAECERLQKICDEINVKKTLERKERKEK